MNERREPTLLALPENSWIAEQKGWLPTNEDGASLPVPVFKEHLFTFSITDSTERLSCGGGKMRSFWFALFSTQINTGHHKDDWTISVWKQLFHLTPIRMATIKQQQQTWNNKCRQRCRGLGTLVPYCGRQHGSSSKNQRKFLYDPVISFLGMCLKGSRPLFVCPHAWWELSTIAKRWKQPSYLLMDEGIKKIGSIHKGNIIQPWKVRTVWHMLPHGRILRILCEGKFQGPGGRRE